jgi:hypothetical protein
VPHDEPASATLLEGLNHAAAAQGYLVARVSAAETRVRMMDQLFFRIAEQIPWEQAHVRVLNGIIESQGYTVPPLDGASFVDALAAANDLGTELLRLELRRKVEGVVFKRRSLAKDFRVGMTQLCLAQLSGGSDGTTTTEAIGDWLTGKVKTVSGQAIRDLDPMAIPRSATSDRLRTVESVGDLEHVAERVAHHRPAISVGRVERRLDDGGAGSHCSLTGGVGVVDVDIQERREQVALARFADQQQGVTDSQLRRPTAGHFTFGIERGAEELDLRGEVGHDDSCRQRVVAIGRGHWWTVSQPTVGVLATD